MTETDERLPWRTGAGRFALVPARLLGHGKTLSSAQLMARWHRRLRTPAPCIVMMNCLQSASPIAVRATTVTRTQTVCRASRSSCDR
jgi:hypothetical protein